MSRDRADRPKGFYWVRVVWKWGPELDTPDNPSEWVVAQWLGWGWMFPGVDGFNFRPRILEVDERQVERDV